MKYGNYLGVFLLIAAFLLAGCGNKDPLKGISKIAIIGITYSKGIEKNGNPEIVLFSPGKKLGALLNGPPVGNPPAPEEASEPKKVKKPSDFGIDQELKQYFDSIVADLSRMISDKNVVILTPSDFADNATFASLKKDKNDSVLAKLAKPYYSPEPYASAVHPHKKEVLAKLAQELGVDAVVTIKLSIIEESSKKVFLSHKKLGIMSSIGMTDKDGNKILSKGSITRVMGDSEVDANALIFGDDSVFDLDVDNTFTFEQIRKKYLARMGILLARKS